MRNLGFKDIFTVSRILKKMNIKFEYQPGMDEKAIGTLFIQSFIESIGSAEAEVTAFLADLKGLNVEEIKNLSLDDTFDMIMEFKDLPDIQNFFTRVSKLMGESSQSSSLAATLT